MAVMNMSSHLLLKNLHPYSSSSPLRLSSSQSIGIFRVSVNKGCVDRRQLKDCSTKASLDPNQIFDLSTEFSSTIHNALYTLGDAASDSTLQDVLTSAASSSADAITAVTDGATSGTAMEFVKQQDWVSGLADVLESGLKLLESGFVALHVPYAYGFSIILLTILIKLAIYPLTKTQVESSIAMQALAPKIKAVQEKYKGDQERIQIETSRLYQRAGVNPLAGCLPTLATIPVWIALYRTLSNVAQEGELKEGFFWIPSLAGPTSIAMRTGGSGTSWLFPFIDGQPPLGWGPTAAYLVLPILLVASQYYSMQVMQPATTDPSQKQTQQILKFLPLMIGFFSLQVPSGLSLYWLVNNVLSTAQQVYLKQMGGAKPAVDSSNISIIDAGQAKRSSASIVATEVEKERERKRGEKFRALKEAEEARKAAARKAAEDAAVASAAKEKEAISALAAGEDQTETSEDVEGEQLTASDSSSPVKAENGVGQVSNSRRSKRSKRTRKVA